MHRKCRSATYPRDPSIKRFPVTDDQVPWTTPYADYDPTDYTSPSVTAMPVWADYDVRNGLPEDVSAPKWNEVDGQVDRTSFCGRYEIVDGAPRNPIGRTGVKGRGCLGRWGPNHAADPIVTRWKRHDDGTIAADVSGRKILQFVSVLRRDNGEWAIPGGMVDPGDNVSATMKKEFGEEAMNSLQASDKEKEHIHSCIDATFGNPLDVYKGYVDDPRNTDNAWMETVACNFHDDTGDGVGRFTLHAGDDAVGVKWTDIHGRLKLYASHAEFIQRVASMHDAFW